MRAWGLLDWGLLRLKEHGKLEWRFMTDVLMTRSLDPWTKPSLPPLEIKARHGCLLRKISCHKNLSFSHKLRYDKNSNSSYAESIVDIMDTLVCTYFLPLFPHHRLATSWCCVDSAKIFSPHDVAPLWIMHTTGRRRIFAHSRMHYVSLHDTSLIFLCSFFIFFFSRHPIVGHREK
jgi:hypothetical protein